MSGKIAILKRMQVTLTPHGEELLEAALARGVGRSPEEVIERALETIARREPALTEDKKSVAARLWLLCSRSVKSTTHSGTRGANPGSVA